MDKITIAHASIGILVFEEEYDWWTCQAEVHPGHSMDFHVSTWTGTELQIGTGELLDRAAKYLEWVRRSEATVHRRVADTFTEPYNDFWSDSLGPLTSEQVLNQVSLSSIQLRTDGSAYWYYSDGGLFGNHLIEVRVDSTHTVTEMLLAG
jgi:hypothetical protein